MNAWGGLVCCQQRQQRTDRAEAENCLDFDLPAICCWRAYYFSISALGRFHITRERGREWRSRRHLLVAC